MKNTNRNILFAALLGLLLGILIKNFPDSSFYGPFMALIELLGQLFIKALKMILVPLVFFSIVVGISNLGNAKKADRIWKLTLSYYFLTMAIAVILALFVMNFVKPGVGINLDLWELENDIVSQTMSFGDFFTQFILSLFVNPFASLASGNILPIIIFAIFIGIAFNGASKKMAMGRELFESFYEVMLKIVEWIMIVAPIGIFALLLKLVESQSLELFNKMGIFIGTVIGIILIHGLIILPLINYFFTRINLKELWTKGRPALITAFATSSSSATLAMTLNVANKDFKVKKTVSNFVLPLGATINMDGTALYEAAAALFIANLVGLDLTVSQQMILFFVAMVASIGAPGIPSAGMVTMAMVLQVLGLPLEALAILLPMDRLLDTFRTTVNVEGDLIGSLIVNKLT
ncbi:MAG: dicarboxylate/amino acid:cation symporter [Methylophilaceae bacterium]|nr:dicarboxylate/amino acid:cation symporter [Methylophilaceae bacterium]MBL6729114.1 dicarboxylate/amino acid:cation symporter [Methylophilaceae bacterium]MBL6791625.1 dicarboxylate/amino acid:cation symporter [Methylophilaceae bacterium]